MKSCDRRALLEELRVRDVAEVVTAALDRAAGADRHGALHHDRVLGGVAELLDHALDAREVGVARVGGRRVDAAEQELGVLEHVAHVGGEVEPLAVRARRAPTGRARRSARRRARARRPSPGGCRAVDLVTQLGEAGAGDQADPAHADDPYRLLFGRHEAGDAYRWVVDSAMEIIWSSVSSAESVFGPSRRPGASSRRRAAWRRPRSRCRRCARGSASPWGCP